MAFRGLKTVFNSAACRPGNWFHALLDRTGVSENEHAAIQIADLDIYQSYASRGETENNIRS